MKVVYAIRKEVYGEEDDEAIYVDPKNDKEAMNSKDAKDWKKGLYEEYDNCYTERKACVFVKNPGNVEVLGSRNVYKKKLHAITK